MKESYPHTSTWPYMMSVLLLLGLVLAPPVRWPQTVRKIYELTSNVFEKPAPPLTEAAPERVVVAFNPIEQDQKTSKQSQPATQDRAATLDSILDLPADPISQRATAQHQPANSIAPPSDSSNTYVWQPPPNWSPEPIKPLDPANALTETVGDSHSQLGLAGTSATEPSLAEPSLAEPTLAVPDRADVSPPVANQVGTWIEKVTGDHQGPQATFDKTATQSGAGETETKKASTISKSVAENTEQTPSDQDTQTVASVPDAWPTSEVIEQLLAPAYEDKVLKNWAIEIRKALQQLEGRRVAGTADQVARVARLRELASMEVDRSRWPDVHRTLHDRIRFAVLRRVDVWEPLLNIAITEPSSFATYRASKELSAEARRLENVLASSEDTKPWIEYLSLARLHMPSTNPVEGRALADAILGKMLSKRLTEEQRRYLQGPQFRQIETLLRNMIAKSVHPSEVMRALETYESSPNRTTSNELILLIQRWRSAPKNELYKRAIEIIISHYRNANLRFAVSEDLINRFVPAFRQYGDRVNERILGAAVTGQSSTQSNVAVKLIPDDSGIRLGLLAAGKVQSNTSSRKGPVTMYNRTQSSFAAGKEVMLRPDGLFVSRAEARAANSGNQLLGMQTDWDDVPLIGRIVRSVAQQEITDQRAQVRAETQMRVRQQAKQRIDKEIDQRVATAGENLGRNVVDPLRRLELDPKAMELRTTAERVIVRTRLASPWQFAAHSPRPQIRADSKMSLHIHQSAANNIIEQLQLQNRRMTLEELLASLSERFGIPLQMANDDHKDAIIQFAEHPLEFDFNDGRIRLTMHFAELNSGRRVWKNFSIRGYYLADVRELVVELEREDGIELIGERIGLRDQIALRGIFTKVLGKHTRLQILQNAIQQQPQLKSLTVTQFTIRDGWLALAFGENATQRMTDRSKVTGR